MSEDIELMNLDVDEEGGITPMAESTVTFNKYTGTGVIADSDYHKVIWKGLTKGGKAVQITLPKAVNLGNIDWTFVEKNDTVPQIVWTSVYENTDYMSTSTDEPFEILAEDTLDAGAEEILLGAGVMYIDNLESPIALTRGGGAFNVTRTYRRINADGDRGAVQGRIEMTDSEATLTVNTLQFLTKVDSLYPAIKKTTGIHL